jgi:hypothetical protein
MINLIDYFSPLNLKTLSYFTLLWIFFDMVGTLVKKVIVNKQSKDYSRVVNWLIGFGVFIFVWFLLSLKIIYSKNNILVSIIFLTAISLPYYLKTKSYLNLFKEFKKLIIPILIISAFLPSVFIKASLPPYYSDEMAYHFMSASDLQHITPMKFTGDIYWDSPRIMDMFYSIVFSLTHTFSIARLFHFTILATGMLYAFNILKKNFGTLVGFLFVFVFFSIPQDIVLTSTLGFVDVAAYSFLLMGVVSAVDFFMNRDKRFLILSILFWAMNLGTKYTGVTSFVVFTATFLFLAYFYNQKLLKVIDRKLVTKIIVVFVIFGGYWYIKNFIAYGNPIFPFLFPCKGSFNFQCADTGSFFGDWTMKVTFSNAYQILSLIFNKNVFLRVSVVILPFFVFLGKNRKIKLLTVLLVAPVLLELVVLKYFSGFYIRYHQHLQFYLMLALVIQFANVFPNSDRKNLSRLILSGLIITCAATYLYSVRYFNSLNFLNWYEIGYATGSVDIYDWVRWRFPTMDHTLKWCENPPGEKITKLARFDPDLIWYDYEGLMRSFLTNCIYVNPPLEGVEIGNVLDTAMDEKLNFYIASSSKCQTNEEVIADRKPYEDDYKFYLRQLNNEIICNSTEVVPYLYSFDYENLPSTDKM